MLRRRMLLLSLIPLSLLLPACTSPSTKLAIQSEREVETLQDEIVSNLAFNNKLYMYRELKEKIAQNQATSEYLNNLWNAREGLEANLIQWERARTLKLLTVTTKLISDQSIFDLKYKRMRDRYDEIVKPEPNAPESK